MSEGDATEAVRQNGEALRRAFDGAAARHDLPHRALGFPGRLELRFQAAGGVSAAEQERIFGESLLRHDVLPTRTTFVCATMTANDLDQAAHAFDAGMATIAGVME